MGRFSAALALCILAGHVWINFKVSFTYLLEKWDLGYASYRWRKEVKGLLNTNSKPNRYVLINRQQDTFSEAGIGLNKVRRVCSVGVATERNTLDWSFNLQPNYQARAVRGTLNV